MVQLGAFCSSVVEKTFTMRQTRSETKKSLYWASFNFFLAFIVYSDLLSHKVGIFGQFDSVLVRISECILAAVLTMNVLANIFKYVWPRFLCNPIEVNNKQKQLLGIRDYESGFRLFRTPQIDRKYPDLSPILNASNQSHLSGYSSHSPSHYSNLAATNQAYYLRNMSFSPDLSHRYPASSPNSTRSFDMSLRYRDKSLSPLSPWIPRDLTSSWHSRTSPPIRLSTVSPTEQITDETTLSKYLREEEEKQYKSFLSSPDSSGNVSSFWSYQRVPGDQSHILRKYEYQLASRSTQALSPDDRDDSPHPRSDPWVRLGVSEDTRTVWMERLRQWFCATIVARVSKEILKVNKRLARIGCEDLQIGEVSTATLKQLAFTKSLHVPTLNALIPYLEVTTNHSYVVKRLHELAKGGCMSDYDWNGGGSYGKPWGENLPNDATLLAHQFCAYLDSRLPADAKYPDGKSFTSQYFVKAPQKPNLTRGDNLLLFQAKINPPHFNIVIGAEIWPVSKGRNNFFNAILLFLYQIKIKHHGMLGRVNLGLSGVNMLHIVDPAKS